MTLQAVTPASWPEVQGLDQTRQWSPNLGGAPPQRDGSSSFGPAMLIRENRTAMAVGILENSEMAGYPGVAVVLIWVDSSLARAGLALEAFAMYVENVFASGARLVHLEVLEFNRPVHRMMARIGVREQARMREHVYAAGRFWDVLVYAFDHQQFKQMSSRYAHNLPGGGKPPAALGGRRRPPSPQ